MQSPAQQHLLAVLTAAGQPHQSSLAHPGPQPATERQGGPGRPAGPDPPALPFCQPQPLSVSARRSPGWAPAAAAGPQPNQQHQPQSLGEAAQPDGVTAAGKPIADHRGGARQRLCYVSFPFIKCVTQFPLPSTSLHLKQQGWQAGLHTSAEVLIASLTENNE